MLGPVLLKGQWRGHGKTFGLKNSSLTPTQTMINDNGCYTNDKGPPDSVFVSGAVNRRKAMCHCGRN